MSVGSKRTPPDGYSCPECGGPIICTADAGHYECEDEECDGTEILFSTPHSETRWNIRSNYTNYTDREGFERGVEMVVGHQLDGDEVRYDHKSRTAIVRKNNAIMTVVNVTDTSKRWTELHAAIRTCVCVLKSPQAAGELCADAGINVKQFREITSDLRARSGKQSGRSAGSATQKAYSDQSAESEGA